jgi:hypothetical protein
LGVKRVLLRGTGRNLDWLLTTKPGLEATVKEPSTAGQELLSGRRRGLYSPSQWDVNTSVRCAWFIEWLLESLPSHHACNFMSSRRVVSYARALLFSISSAARSPLCIAPCTVPTCPTLVASPATNSVFSTACERTRCDSRPSTGT